MCSQTKKKEKQIFYKIQTDQSESVPPKQTTKKKSRKPRKHDFRKRHTHANQSDEKKRGVEWVKASCISSDKHDASY